jgi:hypothetical protein
MAWALVLLAVALGFVALTGGVDPELVAAIPAEARAAYIAGSDIVASGAYFPDRFPLRGTSTAVEDPENNAPTF